MAVKVKVPKLTENTDEVTITAWYRKEGQAIAKGEPLVEMTTDKAVFDVESPAAGVVRQIIAKEKSVVPTGYVVALIGEASETLPDVAAANARLLEKRGDARPAAVKAAPAVKPQAAAPAAAPASDPSALRATPAARRLAKEKGIDLARVKAETGADVVTEDMVRRFL
jgi:pyruvate/2-oxoglutarate dehydrogenase complex dihydrolipoamide acyltransferase (E2) component